MRVFVTGSTGFVGSAVVRELLGAGHSVLGLARTDKGVEQLKAQGAEALFGTIEDLEVLKRGASESDAVIHLAFIHNFADFAGCCAIDREAITAMGSALVEAGGDRALVITSGTMMLAQGKLGTEDDAADISNPMAAARGASEKVCLDFAKHGVRASVVRLPPVTHGPGGNSGFMGPFVSVALEKGVSAYVGDGQSHWCAGHRDDAAKLYRLAIEKAEPGSIFHAVGEESVTIKDIATEVGKHMDIPVVRISTEEVPEHFGWFQFGVMADNTASSAKTKEVLGWNPTGPTVLKDVPVVIEFIKSHRSQF
ncbi:alcohol dehydrogenase [Fusarium beomiforme]|uniref:Alcohol dehydrogenase n=1 Tax=Fusarium beomiforme TaxID=44412 RepID=A0A9P5ASC7_9HYPO|nr:alcohol dehydrogenase [Fusarium beomiforme]